METDSTDNGKENQGDDPKQNLKIVIDKSHGEENDIYDKLVNFLKERGEVTFLQKKQTDWTLLNKNDVLFLIAPKKEWSDTEVETIRSYVESDGGFLVVMTIEGNKPERLNKLLEPFGLVVLKDKVGDGNLSRENLEDSKLLVGVESLAAGTVWAYGSISIADSNQAEVVLRYNNSILGMKRATGKGTVYLFSCLPVFGNRQLNQAGNKALLDNLLWYLKNPSMIRPVPVITEDKEVVEEEAEGEVEEEAGGEEIVVSLQPDQSTMLIFTPLRVVIAKIKGASFLGTIIGAGLGGVIGAGMADGIAKRERAEKISRLSPEDILMENSNNLAIPYEEINRLELSKGVKLWDMRGIRIFTREKKHEFSCTYIKNFQDEIPSLAEKFQPLLGDKLSIVDK